MISPRSSRLSCVALGLVALGCNQQQQQDIPNRVLDRPTDVALVCAQRVCADVEQTDCVMEAQSLDVCARDTGSCTSDNPHLVGFVANSERNEIAMFARCANRLIDMSVEVPGYNFIPAGILPTDLDASHDGCSVVSANVGSCDLSLLDAPQLAGFALGDKDDVDEPSTLVTNLVPHTYDVGEGVRRPLGARPGQVLMVPPSLSQAPVINTGEVLEGVCDSRAQASVYVTFPTCNLLAEIDLRTGDVLQSRQFKSNEQGGIDVDDMGVNPICPVECPTQFDELPPAEELDSDGPFIQALELSVPPKTGAESDAADLIFTGRHLYVGGLGSDVLFEIPIRESGQWETATQQLELAEAGGIKGIRASPPVTARIQIESGADHSQFIYVVAGDGSTRVVGRELTSDPDVALVECETQLDPTLVPEAELLACVPVTQSPNGGQPTQRRGFSRGPGIRPGRGEEVTDWMFRKTYATFEDPEDAETDEDSVDAGPVNEPSTVAVGVTNGGYAIYTMIDQSRASGETQVAELGGPGGSNFSSVMDVRMFPHSLWPDQSRGLRAQLPLLLDQAPGRVIDPDSGPTKQLAPSLRRIDAAYVNDEQAAVKLDVGGDFDQLGAGKEPLYEEPAARVVVHDYRSWGSTGSSAWTLEWEGTIQATGSATGRVECTWPGYLDGTCLKPAELHDAAASFCDDGVLPGDKLVIIGCREDSECGDGRICLRESAGATESSGICISGTGTSQEVDERVARLRIACENFISDPCGEARREYLITEAYQDRLVFDALPQPRLSYLRTAADQGDCPSGMVPRTPEAPDECVCLAGYSEAACQSGEGCCPDLDSTYLDGQADILELEDRFVCLEEQPDEACLSDADCDYVLDDGEVVRYACIDSRCRQRCVAGEEDQCLQRRLPGPACFEEFVRYQVALNDAFRVSGPGLNFVTARVEAVGDELECQPTQNPDISQLLTSRLPLPRSADADDPDWLSIPVCPSDSVLPTDPNPCRIDAPRQSNRFHLIEYEGEPVSALRFSNPVFSVVLDLSDLTTLVGEVPDTDGAVWPKQAAGFLRSRIPRGYRMEFGFASGYLPFAQRLLLEGSPTTFPIRIVPGPQEGVAYIVDGSGPGTTSSIRGQVLRVFLGSEILTDQAFNGVR